jgi:hypothetical protein
VAHRVEWSNNLLEKGMKANPTFWFLPFYIGYNQFFYLRDYEVAARYMAQASNLPDRPEWVPKLAARLYAQGGNHDTALNFLAMMWEQNRDLRVREALELRMKEVVMDRDIGILDNAVSLYAKQEGTYPHQLSDLVKNGILHAVPTEPFGGVYRLDVSTGKVGSSTHPERLRVYEPK